MVLCPALIQNSDRGIAGIPTKMLRKVNLTMSRLRTKQYLAMGAVKGYAEPLLIVTGLQNEGCGHCE